MRLADYYHFPGVQAFSGIANLVQQLVTADLDAARVVMQQHVEAQHKVAVAAFQNLLADMVTGIAGLAPNAFETQR